MSLDQLANSRVLTPREYNFFKDCMDFYATEMEDYFEKLSFKEQVKLMLRTCPTKCNICKIVLKWIESK